MLGSNGTVLSDITPRAGPETVYNFEVAGEHVYYVGSDGLLVHNSYLAKALENSPWLKNAGKGGRTYVGTLKQARRLKLHGDHVLPKAVIQAVLKEARVSKATREFIEKHIQDGAKNLRLMDGALNKSKWMRNMTEWAKTGPSRISVGAFSSRTPNSDRLRLKTPPIQANDSTSSSKGWLYRFRLPMQKPEGPKNSWWKSCWCGISPRSGENSEKCCE